jgi:hypothetical protein
MDNTAIVEEVKNDRVKIANEMSSLRRRKVVNTDVRIRFSATGEKEHKNSMELGKLG